MEDSTTHPDIDPPAGVVRFLTSRFDDIVEPLGYDSNVKKARFVGCGIATMSRIRSGQQNPGPAFIAMVYRAIRALPHPLDPGQLFDFDGRGDRR